MSPVVSFWHGPARTIYPNRDKHVMIGRRVTTRNSSIMVNRQRMVIAIVALVVVALLLPSGASAHNVSKRDATFVKSMTGRAVVPFLYLGAKHMVTGYDHLLFL